MGFARNAAWGIMAGAATALARAATRKVLHDGGGTPKLPRAARRRRGLRMMLVWAAATGVILAVADVLREQREHTQRVA